MTERSRAVGIFNNALETEAALQELDKSHFSLERVFVIARNKDKENQVVENTELCTSLRDRFDTKISSMARQNGLAEGEAVVSLTNVLSHLDIPVDSARLYNGLVAEGKFLVMVEGGEADTLGAETILKRTGIQEWVIYKIVLEHPEVIIVDRRTNH